MKHLLLATSLLLLMGLSYKPCSCELQVRFYKKGKLMLTHTVPSGLAWQMRGNDRITADGLLFNYDSAVYVLTLK